MSGLGALFQEMAMVAETGMPPLSQLHDICDRLALTSGPCSGWAAADGKSWSSVPPQADAVLHTCPFHCSCSPT